MRENGQATDWREALDPIALRVREDLVAARPAPPPLALRVQFAAPRDPRWSQHVPSSAPRPTIRPMVRSERGRWRREGAEWEDLAALRADPGHVSALRRIHSLRLANRYAYVATPETLELGALGPDVWALLVAARDAGVELVPGRRTDPPVRLAVENARVEVRLDRATAGLALRPRVVVEGIAYDPGEVVLVGEPPHGVVLPPGAAGPELLLAGLDAPVSEAVVPLLEAGEVFVPDEDVDRFVLGHLPALRRVVRVAVDDGVDLPRATPPQVVAQVRFDGASSVRIDFSFAYRLGSEEVRAPVAATGPATTAGVVTELARDLDAERRLVASLPQGPRELFTRVGERRALVPTTRLAGLALVDVVTDLLPALEAHDGVRVIVEGAVPDVREAREEPVVELELAEVDPGDRHARTDWYDLRVHVRVEGELVPYQQLFAALARHRSRMLLHSGRWFRLDRPVFDGLRELVDAARHLADPRAPDRMTLGPQHAGLWEHLVAIGLVAHEAASWRERVAGLLGSGAEEVAPPAELAAQLRDYQRTGFAWLATRWRARIGGILADDMGLGKTLQVLALAQWAAAAGDLDGAPLLVVAPTSVAATWAEQAARFAPELRVRSVLETSHGRGSPLRSSVGDAHVVVTTYAVARLDAAEFARVPWSALVLDEAQAAKNHRSVTYAALRGIPAVRTFALTGTPLENSLMDLWSLLSLTAPGLLPDPDAFADAYARPIELGADHRPLPRLRRIVAPVVLRRTKQEVAAELPAKQEQVVRVPLDPEHRRVYDTYLHRERQKVMGILAQDGGRRLSILRSLTLLRRVSLAPGLVDRAHAGVPASKIDALVDLLAPILAAGRRALVFSQFTGFLALVRDRLDAEGVRHEYLDGRTRDRAAPVEAFRSGEAPVFLISLKAGGTGLTLTEADAVFVLDPWWNPAAEAQAVDRTHRIGQSRHVDVYRLVASGTIEEKVVALQERKRDLFARVVDGGRVGGGRVGGEAPGGLSDDEIRRLLTS